MRAALWPSACCGKRRAQERKIARLAKRVVVLVVLVLPTVVYAQSERISISGLTVFDPLGDLQGDSPLGTCDPDFPLVAGPSGLRAAPESKVAPNAAPLSDPSSEVEGAYSHPAKYACSNSALPNFLAELQQGVQSAESNSSDGGVKTSALIAEAKPRPDRNLDIYYRNRREFSLDVGWHPVNIPFIYDFAVGDNYSMTPLKYTLVPIIASLRWHVTNVGWPSILRGNMDFTFSGSVTAIPRGPETHYYSFDFGIRRNFVYRNWKVIPFFEQRGGIGIINAKEPLGVLFSQGQNLTFTYDLGVGARYNIDSKYSFSAGMNYMHISNGYMSEPQFTNYGINVYGPMFGIDVRLGKPHRASQ
jgi:hypothetical protein